MANSVNDFTVNIATANGTGSQSAEPDSTSLNV